MATWNTGWEIEFPAQTVDELRLALVVRDLINGSSFDVESEETGAEFAVDYTAGDELEGTTYRLLLAAEVDGPDDPGLVQAFTEQALEEAIEEAEGLLEQATQVAELPLDRVRFEAVSEDAERWDLVIPDWLAPDGAEVPFGFRAFDAASGAPVPDDATLDGHGRVVAVPFDGRLLLVGIPAPVEHDEPGDEG
ncbi:MAG: hypothetical protein MUC56_05050 [Thermoanaerobaculales bacterium]|jgi:hypothetical protein|nr:hypothetical protein [Thermoanaerobaculales bacterium]